MKILHVFNELKPSGGEAMMLSAASVWLNSDKHSILSTGDQVGIFSTTLENAGYTILHLPFRKNLSFFREFGALVLKGDYDIIHLHPERASVWQALAIRMFTSRTLPIVRTVHHLFRFDGRLRIQKILERQVMKHVLRVKFLSNSPSGKRNEAKRFHMDNELAPNWYDDRLFTPPSSEQRAAARKTLGWAPDTTVFISLGGNWAYKNYDLIVSALSRIPAALDVIYAQVGLQGEGAPLESLASETGVTHRLQCRGVVAETLPYLHAADAYLMPSSEEGFGVAAVEAMASGLPAILSDVEALCDFRETVEGIHFIDPTPESIATAMVKFVMMPGDQRIHLGTTQANTVKTHYGLASGPETYLQIWRTIISKQTHD
ncbi:MAG: glycosyltransferase [Akkermansiaceae bacterium]|nr:glycosyltransferase [Akkermansiaceae bacterium]